VGRHRHVVNVRADGIAVVLGPLLSDTRITAAALVDVDSGMVLDAWSADTQEPGSPDLELIGAQHAEVLRCALALLRSWPTAGLEDDGCEVVLGADGGARHLLRTVPDPHGDHLALAVVVDGPPRVLDRVRKRLRSISADALTAGPSMTRRPVLGGWSFTMPAPDVPGSPGHGFAPPPVRVGPDGYAPDDLDGTAPVARSPGRPVDDVRVTLPGPREGRAAPGAAERPVERPGARPTVPAEPVPRRPSPPAALPAPSPARRPDA
jgi:hypothetical protein